MMSEYLGGGVGLDSGSLANTLSLLLVDRRGMSSFMISGPPRELLPLASPSSLLPMLADLLLRSQAPAVVVLSVLVGAAGFGLPTAAGELLTLLAPPPWLWKVGLRMCRAEKLISPRLTPGLTHVSLLDLPPPKVLLMKLILESTLSERTFLCPGELAGRELVVGLTAVATASLLVARNNRLSTRCPGASTLPAVTAWLPAGRTLAAPPALDTLLTRAVLLLDIEPGGSDAAADSLLRCAGLLLETAEEEDRIVGVMGGDKENWLLMVDSLAFFASGPPRVGTRRCEADTTTLVVWLVAAPLVVTSVVPEGRLAVLVLLAER